MNLAIIKFDSLELQRRFCVTSCNWTIFGDLVYFWHLRYRMTISGGGNIYFVSAYILTTDNRQGIRRAAVSSDKEY